MKGRISGAILAPYLPFDEKKRLKEAVLSKYLDVIIRAGPDALYCLGSVQEFAALTVEQRKLAAEVIMGLVATRVPTVIHVASTVLEETVELACHAEGIGAAAVYCVPPYYHSLDEKGLIQYFRTVAASITIPVHLYNIPQNTKVNFSPSLLVEMGKIPGIEGVKDSSGDLVQMQRYIDFSGLDVFQGSDALYLSSLVVGAAGCISGQVGALMPDLPVKLLQAFRGRDFGQAMQIQHQITTVARLRAGYPNWIQMWKECIRLVWGFDMGKDVVGYSPMTKEELATLEKQLKELKLV